MPDLLDRIRTEMNTRLTELRPLVDEHRRLHAALQALGDVADSAAAGSTSAAAGSTSAAAGSTSAAAVSPSAAAVSPSPPAPAKPRARKATPAKQRARAPRGANRAAIVRALQDRPGATGAELATVSGVERNTLYTVLTRLVRAGQVQTQSLPTGRTGYALSEPPQEGWSSAAAPADESAAADEQADSPPPPKT